MPRKLLLLLMEQFVELSAALALHTPEHLVSHPYSPCFKSIDPPNYTQYNKPFRCCASARRDQVFLLYVVW